MPLWNFPNTHFKPQPNFKYANQVFQDFLNTHFRAILELPVLKSFTPPAIGLLGAVLNILLP